MSTDERDKQMQTKQMVKVWTNIRTFETESYKGEPAINIMNRISSKAERVLKIQRLSSK